MTVTNITVGKKILSEETAEECTISMLKFSMLAIPRLDQIRQNFIDPFGQVPSGKLKFQQRYSTVEKT